MSEWISRSMLLFQSYINNLIDHHQQGEAIHVIEKDGNTGLPRHFIPRNDMDCFRHAALAAGLLRSWQRRGELRDF